jgi:hypothetical protein
MNDHNKFSIKHSAFKRLKMLIIAALICILPCGCGIVKTAVVATVAVVGFAGYAVYKTGEAVVVGVGKAGSAVATGAGTAVSVVFINGDFKTQYPERLQTVWTAARVAFEKAMLVKIDGSFDALTGELTADTRDGTKITLKLKSNVAQATEASIRVGITGNMEMSETIHNLILQELKAPSGPPALPRTAQEIKS